jgi:hypothetical protein
LVADKRWSEGAQILGRTTHHLSIEYHPGKKMATKVWQREEEGNWASIGVKSLGLN